MIFYGFKIFRLTLIIFTISYFIGILWYKFIKGFNDNTDFWTFYHMEEKSDWEQLIIVVYFAFTTLTTVGYGDYYAISP